MPSFNTATSHIHYEFEAGHSPSAPTLLLSNSLGTTLDMWSPQVEALRGRFGLLRYDTRGHGNSGVPPGPYSMDDLGKDALALLDHLSLERVHACGLSLGGMTVQWLAVNAASRLGSAIICNIGAATASPSFWRERTDLVLREGMSAIVDGVMSRFFSPHFQETNPSQVDGVRQGFLKTPAVGYAGCCSAIADMDFRRDLPGVTVPTLVIAGTHDQAAPRDSVREVADAIPKAVYAEIDAAHISNIENPAAFNAALLDFLRVHQS